MCNQRPYDLVSSVIPLAIGQIRPTILCIALHWTLLPTSSLCFVRTRRATPPQRLAPYPPVFKFNYLLKGFLNFLPLPSGEHRQDRTEYRIVISDAAANPSLFVSGHLRLLHNDCFTVFRTLIERDSNLPSSSVSPSRLELVLHLGTHACT